MVEASEPLLPRDRPRYAMGVGMPDELPEYVARGIDMMDCVLPSRNARNGYLFTSQGRVIIKHARYKDDPAVLAWQLMNEAEVKPASVGPCAANAPALLKSFAADVSAAVKRMRG